VTTSGGQIARYRPAAAESDFLASGFDQLYGVAITPGGIVAVEQGPGRLLLLHDRGTVETIASGLDRAVGVAVGPDGAVFVAESGAGRVVRVTPSGTETVIDGLGSPQGLLVTDGRLVVVDAGAKAVVSVDSMTGDRSTIASGLAIGAPPGVEPKPLRGMPPFSGPQGPFAGIAEGPDGTLYVSADGEGSVLALTRERP
jgi:DNA-binding beta-propeller fold protein YncE